MSIFKKVRAAAAVFFVVAISLLFLDFTGSVHIYLGWCAKIQIVPSILSLNIFALIVLIAMLFVLGRFYCSAICPLGVFQDIVSRIAGVVKKNRFSYKPPQIILVVLRFAILGVFVLAVIFNVAVFTAAIEPYSIYGRIVSQIFAPIYLSGNNVLAYFAERANSYAFYTVDIWLKSAGALAVAVISFVIIVGFAVKSGRGYCNTVCPVGAFLALFVKFSRILPRIDKDKCGSCGLCAQNCKAQCIDPDGKEIDYLRCVACFNCAVYCPQGAINYLPDSKDRSVKYEKNKN